ncbi:RNA polymerase sigma-70 factor, ECF subfamily [Sphingopyxis sp. YR583]|nr:RNA polymerase sigma-70 factor, ECF subfamily [Sphingopyxis sp. YR583]
MAWQSDDPRLRMALTAFFFRRVGSSAEAEDMTQEVFVRLAQQGERSVRSADSYIFAIAANLLRDKARRDRVRATYREEKRLEDYVGVDPLDPHRIASGRERLGKLARSLETLPDKTRRIFVLCRIENIDKATVAESFGLTIRMVEIHIRRALEHLYAEVDTET